MPYQTATNPSTGEKLVLVGDQWQPYTQSATGAGGAKAFLVGDKWLTDTTPASAEAKTEIPGPRKVTTAELALASPPARLLLGAAAPFVGAFQAGANVGDWINEKIGQKPVVSKAVADWWNDVQAMKQRGLEASSPETKFGAKPVDILGAVGGMLPGVGVVGKTATVRQAVKEGAKVGAVMGAAQPGTEKLSDQAVGAALGGAVGAVAPIVIPTAAKAAGWVWDAANGRYLQVKAGQILREIAGDKLPEIQAVLKSAEITRPGKTAAQVVQEAGISHPTWQAMGEKGAKVRDVQAANRLLQEEAARANMLRATTPDLETAIANQEQIGQALYGRAQAADVMRQQLAAQEAAAGRAMGAAAGYETPAAVTPALDALRQNPIIAAAAKEAKILAASKGVPIQDPMASLEGLHLMKVAIDNQFKNRTSTTALQKFSDAALNNTKTQLLAAIEGTANQPGLSPLYGAARQGYAEASAPVNQARVLNAMQDVLAKPGGGERATQFLNVLGSGENALLKRANQQPRFGSLEEVLTPEQMQAVNKVGAELLRDEQMKRMADMGADRLRRILRESPTTLPPTSSAAIVFNKVMSPLKGRVSDKTLEVLAKGMESGAGAAELLATIPAAERSMVLKALTDAKGWAAKAGLGAATTTAGGAVNMLSGKRNENQNALAK